MSYVVVKTEEHVQGMILALSKASAWIPVAKLTGNGSLGTDMKTWIRQLNNYLDKGSLPQRGGPVYNWLTGDLNTPLADYEV